MLSAITAAPAAVLSATAITVADIITLAVPVEQSLLGVITYLLAVVLCVLRATKPAAHLAATWLITFGIELTARV